LLLAKPVERWFANLTLQVLGFPTLLRTRQPAIAESARGATEHKNYAREPYARKAGLAIQATPLSDCVDSYLLSAAGACVGESRERAAQDALEVLVSAVHVVSFLGEDSMNVTLEKAETSQGSEGLRSYGSDPRPCDQPVVAAVRVLEAHPNRGAAGHTELSAVGCPVMDTTQGNEIVSVVLAALGAELEVVKVDENVIFAAWKRAPVVIATEHGPARRWRDGLLRPDARVGASPTAARDGFGATKRSG
jgi:hypothetical protein